MIGQGIGIALSFGTQTNGVESEKPGGGTSNREKCLFFWRVKRHNLLRNTGDRKKEPRGTLTIRKIGPKCSRKKWKEEVYGLSQQCGGSLDGGVPHLERRQQI